MPSLQTLSEKLGFEKDEREYDVPDISNADVYIEPEPTVTEFLQEVLPSGQQLGQYVYNLFPFLSWIGKYNWTWALGDFIAGATIGAVVVPQSMAYAQLAEVPVEFGLYSSFMGVLIYWFFATSKDITIGPVAVMSKITGNVVLKAQETIPDVPGHTIASALAIIAGAIICFMGLARLGWVIEVIPLPAICAFMTGSAFTIAVGQVPKVMGMKGINTRRAAYKVVIDVLKALPDTRIDAAMGLTALMMLYIIRGFCSYMAKKQPHRAKMYFFISTLRTAFVILLYTAISAGVNVSRKHDPLFRIIEDVPRGFTEAQTPKVTIEIIKAFASELPASVIVMLIEHISISKSFGRVNNYVIDPSQELVAIGVTNLLGPFLGAYPATGSFSRTAIKSKAGVRTPFAGVITAVVVLLAVYALTAVFYYIPESALGAVIMHAVIDVITPLPTVLQFWRVAPLDVVIFFAGVFVAIFDSIEDGIYTTVCVSFAVLVFRLFLSKGRFLGVARVRTMKARSLHSTRSSKDDSKVNAEDTEDGLGLRTGFLPLDHEDGTNPNIDVRSPYPGVFIFRPAEGFNYPNAGHYLNDLTQRIFKETRRTDPARLGKLGDRPWNDNAPRKLEHVEEDTRPLLRAVVLDFTTVNNVDVTSVQTLIDVRNQLARYAAPEPVDFHFANIQSRWAKRGLAAAGFGYRTREPQAPGGGDGEAERPDNYKTIFSIAELGGSDSAASAAALFERAERRAAPVDVESKAGALGTPEDEDDEIARTKKDNDIPRDPTSRRLVAIQGLNRPYFHFDLQEAVEAAVANAERRASRVV